MCNVAVTEIKVLEWEGVLTKMVPVYLGGLRLSTQAKRMEMRPRSASKEKEVKS